MAEVTATVSISEKQVEQGETYDTDDLVVIAHPEWFTAPQPQEPAHEPEAVEALVVDDVPEPVGEQPEEAPPA